MAGATGQRATLKVGTWSGGPVQSTGMLSQMGLRLSSFSQNPFSFFESHKEPGFLHIWGQLNIILLSLIIHLIYLLPSNSH